MTESYREYRDNNPFITPELECPACKMAYLEIEVCQARWVCWVCSKEFRAYKSPDGWELGDEI